MKKQNVVATEAFFGLRYRLEIEDVLTLCCSDYCCRVCKALVERLECMHYYRHCESGSDSELRMCVLRCFLPVCGLITVYCSVDMRLHVP